MAIDGVQALVFDVFGTCVDWRSSIIREGVTLNAAKGLNVDWARFADAWRGRYAPSMNRVRNGELPWTRLDDLHRMALDDLLVEFDLRGLTEAETAHLNLVWRRLSPWPDTAPGLTRLKAKYVIAPLSNGNFALLTNMGKYAGMPWDCILSTELFRAYKPDPSTYLGAAGLLCLRPDEVMMVAAHQGDLRSAQRQGLRTAFVPRPLEHGPDARPDLTPDPSFDLVAPDFEDLARQLGA